MNTYTAKEAKRAAQETLDVFEEDISYFKRDAPTGASKKDRRISDVSGVATDCEPLSPSLQTRQYSYPEIVKLLTNESQGGEKRLGEVSALIEAELKAGRLRKVLAHEGPLKSDLVVRYIKQASNLQLF